MSNNGLFSQSFSCRYETARLYSFHALFQISYLCKMVPVELGWPHYNHRRNTARLMLAKVSQTRTISVSPVLQQIQSTFKVFYAFLQCQQYQQHCQRKSLLNYNGYETIKPSEMIAVTSAVCDTCNSKQEFGKNNSILILYMGKRIWAKKLQRCKFSNTTFRACTFAIYTVKGNYLQYSQRILNQE